jgi:hypothetical protein
MTGEIARFRAGRMQLLLVGDQPGELFAQVADQGILGTGSHGELGLQQRLDQRVLGAGGIGRPAFARKLGGIADRIGETGGAQAVDAAA